MLSSTHFSADPENTVDPGSETSLSLLWHWRAAVTAYPATIAAIDLGGTSFTYAELDRLSDLIAMEILRTDDSGDRPIAAVLGHDARAVVALVALLKTGRLRVVLDTHLPAQRLAQIAELSTATLAIVDDRYADLAATIPTILRTLSFDSLLANALASDISDADLAAQASIELAAGAGRSGTDTFEIVFTSGSTGMPKGVLQRHGTFVNDRFGTQETRGLEAGDRTAVVLPLSFVAGSGQLVTTLLTGATAVLIDPRDTGVGAVVEALRAGDIAVLVCTPHLARGIMAALDPGEVLGGLRCVTTLGESIHGHDVRAIMSHLGADARYANEVGSSEINAFSTHIVHQGDEVADGPLPAGTAFRGKVIRIVDADGRDVAPGEAGEVVVISEFLSGGYWNAPELNAEKFGFDEHGVGSVRQGDLGRMEADGTLRLLGRGDAGVKIRGYLVEPSEIEGALMALDEIAEAVVIPQVSTATPPAPTRLAAYVVPAPGGRTPSSAAIRRALRAVVPEYMVPSEIVQLPSLPRTERGKVDRQSLPPVPVRQPDVDAMDQRELAMSTIWQQVLELPELAPDDDFMALGGDSLSAEELLTLVKQHFGVDLPSTDILAHPTLREFTRRVVSDRAAELTNPDMAPFNRAATGIPLFAFAGAGALALTFLPLARRLPESPVYAFQQHGLERRAAPDRSVEAMAARHLRSILEIHPRGPFRLMGHSFGGVVALEVARQLTAAGHEVESLTILDTYLPRNVEVAEEPASAAQASTRAGRDRGVRAFAGLLLSRIVPDGLPPRDEYGRQIRAHLAGYLKHKGQRQYDSFFDHAVLLQRRYTVRPFAGRSVLVLADENPDGPGAWEGVLTGPRRDIVIGAEHTSILREPFMAELADGLRPVLADTGADAAAEAAAVG
jgi:acyl-coenzyme A synthetase/AMP-(fatty) acid ligase/thioesterase domain-containing protein/acyl carrier protein